MNPGHRLSFAGHILGVVGLGLMLLALGLLAAPFLLLRRIALGLASAWRRVRGTAPQASSSSELTAADLASPDTMLIAVHGTFAREAEWVQPQAPLCRAVDEALHGSERRLVCQFVRWSGGNSLLARARAMDALQSHLARVLQAQPQRRVVLVGHSHGGNVALQVARGFTLHPGLRVVTLATPFLSLRERHLGRLTAVGWPVFLASGAGLLLTVLCLMFGWPLWWAAAAGLGLLVLSFFFIHLEWRAAERDAGLLLKTLPSGEGLEQALAARTLVVSRAGDEADGLLKLAALLNSWISRTLRASPMHEELRDLEAWAVAAAAKLPPGQPLSDQAQRALFLSAWPKVWPQLKRFIGTTNLLFTALHLSALGVGHMLLFMLRHAVGQASVTSTSQVLITSSETPPGRWQHLQTLPSVDDGSALLSHSQIYEDPAVLQAIGEWLREQYA